MKRTGNVPAGTSASTDADVSTRTPEDVHGFGLGERTSTEGWFDNAVQFWEDNMVE